MKTVSLLLLLAPLLTGPADAGRQTRAAAAQAAAAPVAGGQVTSVAFCEMVGRPRLYFGKVVRLTATYQAGHEAAYLEDGRCPPGRRGLVGVRFIGTDESGRAEIRRDVDRIMSREHGGGRARVTVVGVLRDAPDRDFGGYRYRFDVMRFEDISRDDAHDTVVTYDGELRAGTTYRARVRGDRLFGLFLVPPLRPLMHHALRVEWTNLGQFGALRRLRRTPGERQIVFNVISDEIRQMTERRWNRTVRCKVLAVE